ncbi:MAG: transcription elongation factor GreA [Oscillospiraceae bacterium]|nr:transcription elongation factor GreA [Oscillospiraceae bacterium]
MSKEILLTQAGYDDLVKELDYLKTEKRAEIAEKIKVARGFGDLSENSEYDEAKNEQGLVEQKINELEYTLKHAKIVNKEEMHANGINVGSKVTVVDDFGDEEVYDIVGATEFDPFNNKISVESPIGAALIGHKAGDEVEVHLPTGAVMVMTVKSVE